MWLSEFQKHYELEAYRHFLFLIDFGNDYPTGNYTEQTQDKPKYYITLDQFGRPKLGFNIV